VNGYQIKNDEEILIKRFEEVRDEYLGEDNNDVFEIKDLEIYKN
jgi:hypothetical protein